MNGIAGYEEENILSDATILKAQQGEEAAFDEIYQKTYKYAWRIVRSFFINDITECDDIIQEVYLNLYRKIGYYNSEKGEFLPWFKVTVKNVCTTKYNASKNKKFETVSMDAILMSDESDRNVEFEDVRPKFNPEAHIDRQETTRLLQEILDDIPLQHKQCLLLFYANQYKQDEIAEMLNIPQGTVKSRLYNGKKMVKERVLELEKRGTKLYGMAPIVFLIFLFLNDCEVKAASRIGVGFFKNTNLNSSLGNVIPRNFISPNAPNRFSFKGIAVKCTAAVLALGLLGVGGLAIANDKRKEKPVGIEETKKDENQINKSETSFAYNNENESPEQLKKSEDRTEQTYATILPEKPISSNTLAKNPVNSNKPIVSGNLENSNNSALPDEIKKPGSPILPNTPEKPTLPVAPNNSGVPNNPEGPNNPILPELPIAPEPPVIPEPQPEPEPPVTPEPEPPLTPEEKPQEYGDFSIHVVNSANGTNITNAKLEILKDAAIIRTIYTDTQGNASDTQLEAGTYIIQITADQFLPYEGTLVITPDNIVKVETKLERATGACQIGDKKYITIGEAINNANSGDTITVIANVTEEQPIKIPSGMNLTITSKRNVVINRKENTTDSMIINNGDLTLRGPMTFRLSSSGNTLLSNHATLTLSSGVTFENQSSYGTMILNKGSLIMSGQGSGYQCILKGNGNYSNFGIKNEGALHTNNCLFLIQDVAYGIMLDSNSTNDLGDNYQHTGVGSPIYKW